ncbi:MAG: hypothetical protein M3Q14_02170 [bacterium]|nr:hypothetical protein [bacterium]
MIRKAENKLADLYKGAPKLSESSKETLVKVWPWLALVGGILQVLAAIALYRWAAAASDITSTANDFYRSIGAAPIVEERFSAWLWISLALLAVEGVLLLLAYPKLKRRERKGWDLLFLVGLLQVLYALVSFFVDGRGGLFSLLWNLLVSAVVFWLLFAVRDKYHGRSVSSAPVDRPTVDTDNKV